MRIFFFLLSILVTVVCQSQTFRVSDNVLSTSLFQPFAPVGGYSLAFERMLDPGYSRNAAQFSYKINATILSDKKKGELYEFQGKSFYDLDAYRYSGYMFVPEVKYYFTWDAPKGVYINLYGTYSSYMETFIDERPDSNSGYDKKISELGRGIGTGVQFSIFNSLLMDINGGYHLLDISSKSKPNTSEEFSDSKSTKADKLYINVFLGINF